MDRKEARTLLTKELAEYRRLSYAELVANMDNDQYLVVKGPSDREYQIEIQFMWDDKQDEDIRVLAGIDDGSLRGAFLPVCDGFIMSPDGRFVGE